MGTGRGRVVGRAPEFAGAERILHFSGRGHFISLGRRSVANHATAITRFKSGVIPFRALVDRIWINAGVGALSASVRPVYSLDDAVTDLALNADSNDNDIGEYYETSAAQMRGVHSLGNVTWDELRPRFLLPGPGYRLGVHVYNASGAARSMDFRFELLEVVAVG